MDYRVIDTVPASTLDVDDYVTVRNITGKILSYDDTGASIEITIASEQDYGDRVDLSLHPDEYADLLDYDYSGIEV